MKTLIFIGGFYNIAFAIFHSGFWKLWKWDTELKKLSFTNEWVMQILNVQIIYYFIVTAVICFAFPTELLNSKLGIWFLIATAGFWFVRAIQQFAFWELSVPMTIILTLIFLIGTVIFLIPVFTR